MKIAITGGIGSGKTLAINYIKSLGYPVFSADEISRALVNGPRGAEILAPLFPFAVKNGKVDRKALAGVVFQNKEELKKLNAALHPEIMQTLLTEMEKAEGESPLVFAEVPLLFESGTQGDFDRVWVILRSEEARINATVLRDGVSPEEVKNRIKNQTDYSNTDFSAHTILKNGGSEQDFYARLRGEIEQVLKSV